jgi:hypothetical protein
MITLQQLASSVLIAIVVAYATHYLTSQRDLKNRRRERRVDYLITAYHTFSSSCNRDDNDDRIDDVERAVAGIKLLGSPEQIQLVQRLEQQLLDRQDILSVIY